MIKNIEGVLSIEEATELVKAIEANCEKALKDFQKLQQRQKSQRTSVNPT